MLLKLPSAARKEEIIWNFTSDLSTLSFADQESSQLEPVVCCVCDGIPTGPDWACWVGVERLRFLCATSHLDKSRVSEFYRPDLVASYTAPHPLLEPFILSPRTKINHLENTVLICKECKHALDVACDNKVGRCKAKPPINAIANGYLIGDAPKELTCLNEVELAIVSRVRIYCQSWIFYAGCHQQIKGWHTFYRNRNALNVGHLQQLELSGMKGSIVVVLCGPFTSEQKAMTLKRVTVRTEKVIEAFQWLRDHNIYCGNEKIPSAEEIPTPVLVHENE